MLDDFETAGEQKIAGNKFKGSKAFGVAEILNISKFVLFACCKVCFYLPIFVSFRVVFVCVYVPRRVVFFIDVGNEPQHHTALS